MAAMKKPEVEPEELRMTAPLADAYEDRLDHAHDAFSSTSDERVVKAMRRLWQAMQPIAPTGDDGYREIWVRIERGSVDDFREYSLWYDKEDEIPLEQLEKDWLEQYPREFFWKVVRIRAHEDWIGMNFGERALLQVADRGDEHDWYAEIEVELLDWLVGAIEDSIGLVRAGKYRRLVEEELLPRQRTGTILRRDLQSIGDGWGEHRHGDVSESQIDLFESLTKVKGDGWGLPVEAGRVASMTADDYFRWCRLCYQAAGYDGSREFGGEDREPPRTDREWYRRYGDWRDNGLSEIPGDSPEAFDGWYSENERRFDHTFEFIAGSSRTRCRFDVRKDEAGYWLSLTWRCYYHSADMVCFLLALRDEGLPVLVYDADTLVSMLRGEDLIGVVPEGVFPAYCGSRFPEEDVPSFMGFPYEMSEGERDQFIQAVRWQPVRDVELL